MPYKFRCSHSDWLQTGVVARHLDHPCQLCAQCISEAKRFDPSPCPACSYHLTEANSTNASASLAAKQFLKWQSSMVNKWRNARCKEYGKHQRTFLWASTALFEAWNPPPRTYGSSTKQSISSELDSSQNQPPPPLTAQVPTLVVTTADVHREDTDTPVAAQQEVPQASLSLPTTTVDFVPISSDDIIQIAPQAHEQRLSTVERKIEESVSLLKDLLNRHHQKETSDSATLESLHSQCQAIQNTLQAQQSAISKLEQRLQQPPPLLREPPPAETTNPFLSTTHEGGVNYFSQSKHPSPTHDDRTNDHAADCDTIDLTMDTDPALPPFHLSRTAPVHATAHKWLAQLLDEDTPEPDLFSHHNLNSHTSQSKYFLSDTVQYTWRHGVPALVTLWQGTALYIPVDQNWVRVRAGPDLPHYFLDSSSSSIPFIFRPFILRGSKLTEKSHHRQGPPPPRPEHRRDPQTFRPSRLHQQPRSGHHHHSRDRRQSPTSRSAHQPTHRPPNQSHKRKGGHY